MPNPTNTSLSPPEPAPRPPEGLADLQRAFGRAMATPFAFGPDESYRLQVETYPEAITAQMVPCPERGLDGAARLASYNRQYWFRLFNVMQEEYPLTAALAGLNRFNRLVSAFLEAHPPHAPTLRLLSDGFPAFMAAHPDTDENLHRAAYLEWIHIQVFDAPARPTLAPNRLPVAAQDRLLETPLDLQPHLYLFHEEVNLVHWRTVLKSGTHPEGAPVALQPGTGWWAVWRSRNEITSTELGPLQYALLARLREGLPLLGAIEAVCAPLEDEAAAFVAEHIGTWFAWWQTLGWFVHPEADS